MFLVFSFFNICAIILSLFFIGSVLRFLVISGDLLTDFNLKKVIDFHRESGARATINLTSVKDPLQFGVVITDSLRRLMGDEAVAHLTAMHKLGKPNTPEDVAQMVHFLVSDASDTVTGQLYRF